MALAFSVNGPDDIAHAFAAHDEYLAIFTHFYFRSQRGENLRALRPDIDDYYSAPYCFLPRRNNSNRPSNSSGSGFLVFTCMVPYVHGNPAWSYSRGNNNNNNNANQQQHHRAHYQAKEWMEENCTRNSKLKAPHIGSVEEFSSSTSLNLGCEFSIITFTNDGGYPTWKHVSQSFGKKESRNNIFFRSLCVSLSLSP